MRLERWLYTVPLRLRSLFRGGQADRDLDDELQFHVDRLTESHLARGLSPEDARSAALRAMQGLEQRKEECRDTRRVRVVQDALQDVRYAVRTLRGTPGFAVTAILTVALGIGATVAVFTVVNGVLLRPLPFPDPDRLLLVSHTEQGPFITQPGLSDRSYLALRASDRTFEHLAAFSNRTASVRGTGDPAVVSIGHVTHEFFTTLAVQPALGRTFVAEDDERVIVLSDALWRGRFGGDPEILGKPITVDNIPRSIVGVMPAGFDFPAGAAAWMPQTVRFDPHVTLLLPVFGRLKPGVSVAQARAAFAAFAGGLPNQPTAASERWVSGVFPLQDLLVRDVRRPLEIFAAAVCLVLLIACTNVANLLLARATGRDREIAVRAALGASRGRLIRQLLTESTLLALVGGGGGLLLALWGVPALLAVAPNGRIPRVDAIRIDGGVLAFALGVSIATGVLFGLAPALRITRRRLSGSLLPASRTFFSGHERLRSGLVVAEIALALILLTGAGLLLKSFVRLRAVDPGFRPANVLTMTVDLPDEKYPDVERRNAFHTGMLDRLTAVPGATAVGAVNWRPLGDQLIRGDFQLDGGPRVPEALTPDKLAVSAGYFRAMGIRVLRGREFAASDGAADAGVAIVSRSIARFISPSEDVVGRRVALNDNPTPRDWLTIVGVVDDVKQFGQALPSHPAIYQPYLQVTRPFFLGRMTFAMRSDADLRQLAPAMRTALREMDQDQPPRSIVAMDDVIAAATAEPRFQARLLGVFAALALLLALAGTYSLLAYSVARRTHEIGVRMALGAHAGAIVWLIVRRTCALAGTGVALGTVGALLAVRVLAGLLFEVRPHDPATFAAVAATILGTALIASVLPARRATRVDPVDALRHQ